MIPTAPNNKESQMAQAVDNYLRDNPCFFDSRPELLSVLTIAHETGAATSLIERQVAVLRQEQSSLSDKVAWLNTTMQEQRDLASRVFQSSLSLLEQKNSQGIYEILLDLLRHSFGASFVKLFLFVEGKKANTNPGDIQLLNPRSRIRWLFIELFNRNKPLCDSLQVEHLEALFARDAGTIRSTVLIPLRQAENDGLLALGSTQRNNYCLGFQLDLLVYVAKLTNRLLGTVTK